jgi:hypothetical protein
MTTMIKTPGVLRALRSLRTADAVVSVIRAVQNWKVLHA